MSFREGLDDQGTYYQLNEVAGTTPIVFIHGVGLSLEIWKPQRDFFKNHSTIVYDLYGHGRTTSADAITFDKFSDQIDGLMQYLKYPSCHLIGFSLGGLIAAHYASTRSKKINKLILFGTIYGRSAEQQQEAIKRYENVSKEYFDIPKQLSRWFNEDYLSKNPNESQLVSTILENNDHQEFLKSYKLFSHFEDNMILFNQISAPTLIVTGENEVGSTPEMSKKIGEIVKNSKVEIIPDGKHMCGMECADKVNQVFGNFLNDS